MKPLHNTFLATSLATSLIAFCCAGSALAQDMGMPAKPAPVTDHGTPVAGKPLASPAATASATLGTTVVTINYNQPSMRGRKIMGDLVPYGQPWRTGANPATTLITTGDLRIGALTLPAGTYTLYTLPAAPGTPWQLIINKQTGQWGTVYKPEMDFGRTPLKSKTLSSPQEVMSISLDDAHGKTAELHIRWETTDEYVKIEAK
jgi:hypothetical protein